MSVEGGVLSGVPPLLDPLNQFFVQTVFIIAVCRGLSVFSVYLKQPTVIFEIIGGIIIGPSALGKNDNYTATMFPKDSLSNLSLVANIGLVLYLFLVGLEMDPKLLMTHAKKASGIAIIGMAVPFGLGVGISRTLFDTLQGDDEEFAHVNFTSFYMFVGTAMSITAFPVLARMLKEGGLIYTKPGALALGASALNDAIAWCLLVLAISIAQSEDQSTAGFVFLSVCAFALGMFLLIRPLLHRLVAEVEARHNPVMDGHLFAFALCMVFLSAWITALLGVHAIFGAFIFGLVVPRGSRLFRQCIDRTEQLVLTFTLPLYFALSGLYTDITLIDTAQEGAMVVLVCVVASLGKFIGAGGTALCAGMSVRESSVIAVLMNTRGMVELIVLNLGLDSKVLNTRTFSVLVIMCLFTTFITGPLVEFVFPVHLRVRTSAEMQLSGRSLAGGALDQSVKDEVVEVVDVAEMCRDSRLGVAVHCMDQLQSTIRLLSYFVAHNADSELSVTAMHFVEPTHTTKDEFLALNENGRLVRVDEQPADFRTALRFESDRAAKSSHMLSLSMFCEGMGAAVRAFQVQGDPDEFPLEMRRLAKSSECNLVLMPWRASSYAQKLFWSSLHILSCPIALAVHMDAAPLVRERSPTINNNSSSSTFLSSSTHHQGRSSSFFGSTMAYMFDTDDLDPSPVLATAPTRGASTKPSKKRGNEEIVAVVTGRAMDVPIFPILLRFAESKTNLITVHVPRDHDLFDSRVLSALAFFERETSLAPNVRVLHSSEALSTDMDALCSLVSASSFDLCISSFVEPAQLEQSEFLAAMSHLSSRDHPARSTMSSAFADAFKSSNPDAFEVRCQSGMPPRYAYSSLAFPELGELGSKLQQHSVSKACVVLVLHETHKMHYTRRSSLSTAPLSDVALPTSDVDGSALESSSGLQVPHSLRPNSNSSKELSGRISTRVTINDIGLDDIDI